jgi:hypothetical protein
MSAYFYLQKLLGLAGDSQVDQQRLDLTPLNLNRPTIDFQLGVPNKKVLTLT